MTGPKTETVRHKQAVVGGGSVVSSLVNKAIDLLPFELHIPRNWKFDIFSYCGPGTKLQKRLARGDKGINGLDEACKIHDIAYSKYKDSVNRRRADKELAERAWERLKSLKPRGRLLQP